MKFNDRATVHEVVLLDFDERWRCFHCEKKCNHDKHRNALTCSACGSVGEIEQKPAPDGSGTCTNIWWTKGGQREAT